MALDQDKITELVRELMDAESQARDLKYHIEHELFSNAEEAVAKGLVKINWEALRRNRHRR